MSPYPGKPEIRVLHHLARSGGTLISRCLGSMEKIVLLSEIHPLGCTIHNPLQQAYEWFSLFDEAEVRANLSREFTFLEAVELIHRRVMEHDRILVIRDWSHLDFTGVPFLEKPSCRLMLADALRERYTVIPFFTVRNPVDQWISLNRLIMFRRGPRPELRAFLRGYLRFAEFARATGYIRFEDFTRHPDDSLRELCDGLQLPYDSGYAHRWQEYQTITGDNTTPSETRRASDTAISTLGRQLVDQEVLEEFMRYGEYHKAVDLLGYDDV